MTIASTAGDGFVVPSEELLAQTRAGKAVLTVRDGVKTAVCVAKIDCCMAVSAVAVAAGPEDWP